MANGNQHPEEERPPEVRTGVALIAGNLFRAKAVTYVEVDGYAIVEGDVFLGPLDDVADATARLTADLADEVAAAAIIVGPQFRWPNHAIPYSIDPALMNQARVDDAIAHWQANTSYTFVPRDVERDYITFRPWTGCSSPVGRRGGQQFINVGDGCTSGNVIHEIGHTVGLWHEQSREDRDSYVAIDRTKIISGYESNFDQHISDGDDIGPYDYGSIMHYPRDAFSRDGSDTITPTNPPTAQIGQREALSAGDIAAVNSI